MYGYPDQTVYVCYYCNWWLLQSEPWVVVVMNRHLSYRHPMTTATTWMGQPCSRSWRSLEPIRLEHVFASDVVTRGNQERGPWLASGSSVGCEYALVQVIAKLPAITQYFPHGWSLRSSAKQVYFYFCVIYGIVEASSLRFMFLFSPSLTRNTDWSFSVVDWNMHGGAYVQIWLFVQRAVNICLKSKRSSKSAVPLQANGWTKSNKKTWNSIRQRSTTVAQLTQRDSFKDRRDVRRASGSLIERDVKLILVGLSTELVPGFKSRMTALKGGKMTGIRN